MSKKKTDWKIITALGWLVFTVTLSVWWMILGFKYIKNHSMVVLEGMTLILSLAAGGSYIIYSLIREKNNNKKQREFFAAFNHELKTSLASLRLRSEGLLEDLEESIEEKEELEKIVSDTNRLELQIENSLFLSSEENIKLFFEEIELRDFIKQIHPFDNIEISGSMKVNADRRALEVIIKNIIQNAFVHGQAKRVTFNIDKESKTLNILGSTAPFKGDFSRLGELYFRHTQTSRSGIGLYLANTLCKKINASIKYYLDSDQYLATEVKFKGGNV